MTHPDEIKTIGVLGAGQMGSGIAQVAAAAASTSCSSTPRPSLPKLAANESLATWPDRSRRAS